jgi:serine/alanine adding enzyme
MGHRTLLVEALSSGRTVGLLPLAFVRSLIFGRFLVSLPYVNSAGVIAANDHVARRLIDRAVELADEYDVRFLELRHEREIVHPALSHTNNTKVLMRLNLPRTTDELWDSFKSKLRSQIRSGQKHGFEVLWGREQRLNEFYTVFSRNMRDLGTPVYPRELFSAILAQFPADAELCVVRLAGQTVAGALLVHGERSTQVPSASSLKSYNATNANMVMYWHLLQRAVERGQQLFDFGRSSIGSSTYAFKKQWGASPQPATWQYYLRKGSADRMRPESGRYDGLIRIWKRLPVWVTRLIGPTIARGIP